MAPDECCWPVPAVTGLGCVIICAFCDCTVFGCLVSQKKGITRDRALLKLHKKVDTDEFLPAQQWYQQAVACFQGQQGCGPESGDSDVIQESSLKIKVTVLLPGGPEV